MTQTTPRGLTDLAPTASQGTVFLPSTGPAWVPPGAYGGPMFQRLRGPLAWTSTTGVGSTPTGAAVLGHLPPRGFARVNLPQGAWYYSPIPPSTMAGQARGREGGTPGPTGPGQVVRQGTSVRGVAEGPLFQTSVTSSVPPRLVPSGYAQTGGAGGAGVGGQAVWATFSPLTGPGPAPSNRSKFQEEASSFPRRRCACG